MAPSTNSESIENSKIGPHPSYIEIAKPYIFESKFRESQATAGIAEAKDDSIRLQGISWIDNVRKFLHLPVRTYNTAAVYYHKFRLVHPEANGYIDAAAAALFTACKIEDTLKKSKEILCAAYNMKVTPSEQLTPDDPMFEQHSKSIIGLERLMLEASGFDFRNRYPQKLLLKLARHYSVDRATVGKTAYNMSLDLYRTLAPLKQTAATMAVSCVELAGRLWDQNVHQLEAQNGYQDFRITRTEVMETLLDLLDLYTHHRTSTIIGQDHSLEKFIGIRIALNQEASSAAIPRHTRTKQNKAAAAASNGTKQLTNGTSKDHVHKSKKAVGKSPTNPSSSDVNMTDTTGPTPSTTNGTTTISSSSSLSKPGLKDGTIRFMLDPQRAKKEQDTVSEFFDLKEEEYEVEIPVERSSTTERDHHRRRP